MDPVGLDSTASFCVVQLTMLLDSRRGIGRSSRAAAAAAARS